MPTGFETAQMRNETLEKIRVNLTTSNVHALSGDTAAHEVARLLVRKSMIALNALDDGGFHGE